MPAACGAVRVRIASAACRDDRAGEGPGFVDGGGRSVGLRALSAARKLPLRAGRREEPWSRSSTLQGVARYTPDSKERVRDAVDFVELVSARTELRRAGPARYEGSCPFHDERTPSFGIDPEQKVYYCFGCNASGDVFTFV